MNGTMSIRPARSIDLFCFTLLLSAPRRGYAHGDKGKERNSSTRAGLTGLGPSAMVLLKYPIFNSKSGPTQSNKL